MGCRRRAGSPTEVWWHKGIAGGGCGLRRADATFVRGEGFPIGIEVEGDTRLGLAVASDGSGIRGRRIIDRSVGTKSVGRSSCLIYPLFAIVLSWSQSHFPICIINRLILSRPIG